MYNRRLPNGTKECTADGTNLTPLRGRAQQVILKRGEIATAKKVRRFFRVKVRDAIEYKRASRRRTALDVLRGRVEQTHRRGIKRACRGSTECFQICIKAPIFCAPAMLLAGGNSMRFGMTSAERIARHVHQAPHAEAFGDLPQLGAGRREETAQQPAVRSFPSGSASFRRYNRAARRSRPTPPKSKPCPGERVARCSRRVGRSSPAKSLASCPRGMNPSHGGLRSDRAKENLPDRPRHTSRQHCRLSLRPAERSHLEPRHVPIAA